jgi:transposase
LRALDCRLDSDKRLTKRKKGDLKGEIRGFIANDAERKFRELAMKKFGHSKGSLSKALAEALDTWIETHEVEAKK